MKLHFKKSIIQNHQAMDLVRGVRLNDIHMCDLKVARIILLTFNKFSEFQEEILPFMISNQYNKQLIRQFM